MSYNFCVDTTEFKNKHFEKSEPYPKGSCQNIRQDLYYRHIAENVKRRRKENVMALSVGQLAPDFTLLDHRKRPVKLSDFRGQKNVVLAFFPLAWTPI